MPSHHFGICAAAVLLALSAGNSAAQDAFDASAVPSQTGAPVQTQDGEFALRFDPAPDTTSQVTAGEFAFVLGSAQTAPEVLFRDGFE